jgi:hypothetical protein
MPGFSNDRVNERRTGCPAGWVAVDDQHAPAIGGERIHNVQAVYEVTVAATVEDRPVDLIAAEPQRTAVPVSHTRQFDPENQSTNHQPTISNSEPDTVRREHRYLPATHDEPAPATHDEPAPATNDEPVPATGGGPPASRRRRACVRVLCLAGVLLGLACIWGAGTAPVASAASPWWHLGTSDRPTNLGVGGGGSEDIQELSVEATSGLLILIAIEKNLENFHRSAILPFDPSVSEVQGAFERLTGRKVLVEEGTHDTALLHTWTLRFPDQLILGPLVSTKFSRLQVPGECTPGEPESCPGSASVSQVSAGVPTGRQLIASVVNVGDAVADTENAKGEQVPITITDHLPAGVEPVEVEALVGGEGNGAKGPGPVECTLQHAAGTVTPVCAMKEGFLPMFATFEMRVGVVVTGTAKTGELNEVSVSGGEAPAAGVARPITVSSAATLFGVQDYELSLEEEGGSVDTQAGSHPFQMTTTLALNQGPGSLSAKTGHVEAEPAQLPKDLSFKLPPGLIGNPTVFPRCTLAQFAAKECSPQSAIGVAVSTINEPRALGLVTLAAPVFNLEPSVGEPARFGFLPTTETPVIIDTAVRTGGDYGVTATVHNVVQVAGFLNSTVTLWGVPGAQAHDSARGYGCLPGGFGACNPLEEIQPPPFLALPTSCTGQLETSVEADSWAEPSRKLLTEPTEPMPAMDGCNRLPFGPSISVTPDEQDGSTPTGLTVDVHSPQEESLNANGLAEADIRNTTVTLPEGVVLNPAAAGGLEACSEAQVALSSDTEATCPSASKVASIEVTTPLLPNPLIGSAYVAAQDENPFGSLIAMYLVFHDPISGTLVKLAGEVQPNPVTGQLVSTFKNTPQLPFEDLKLHFFGGDRGPLATPAMCGTYPTTASFTPWSGGAAVNPESSFQITSGPNGTPCENPLAFTPSLAAGTTSIQAGGFSQLTTTISREDGQQAIQGVQIHMPNGLSGLLKGVTLCGEQQADQGTCAAASLIGETTVSVGLGGDPYSVKGGRVYLTGPYEGAPFGLSIVNPAKAGPYDLEKGTPCDCVVVRAKIDVDHRTGELTVTTDSTGPYRIPTILDGIPLQIKHVNVLINRPNFTFNPTSCEPLAITSTITSTQNTSHSASVPFQVTNCAILKYTPKIQVASQGQASKLHGASLTFKISYPKGAMGTQSWFNEAKFDLPRQLPARLETLQRACLANTFENNRPACPKASIIGHATVHTQLLPVPLTGPVYFVSNAGEKFPEAVLVLQGYGITIELHGETYIHNGITSATFRNTPDVPFENIEVTLPTGRYSEFGANLPPQDNYNLCGHKLTMPTLLKAQNGTEIHQNTPITITGCKKHHTTKHTKHTKHKK